MPLLMTTKFIFAALAVAFLVAGSVRAARLGLAHPQARTWLLMAGIFAVVSTWLFLTER
jgi:uncharacterized membrane protein HdeD (DUF308 family)